MKRNILLNNPNKYCLVGKIKGLSQECILTRKRFLKNTEKKSLCYRKNVLGVSIRHHLLAYAFMRGLPYTSLERKCREDNKPIIRDILAVVHAHMYSFQTPAWNEERLQKWLNGEAV